MPSRYQTIFTIVGREQSGLSLLNDVRAFVLGRVSEQYGEPELATANEGDWESENGQLRVGSDQRDEIGFFSLNWKRKDDWELRWRFATRGEDIEAEVQVYGPDGDRRTAGPPGLLGSILSKYPCLVRGEAPLSEVLAITNQNADWYVDSLVFNPQRQIPVVAVSERLRGDANGTAAHTLNILRGVATVVTYSYADGAAINRKLGRLACSGGEVRVYRSGAERGDAQEQHRKWRPNGVNWGEVRDECMHLLSLSDGPRVYHEVREEIFRRWDAELAEAGEDVAEDERIVEERLAALQGELVTAEAARRTAEQERDAWSAKNEALERESNREIGRLKQESLETITTINELLDQINSISPDETVIPKLREDNVELSEKIKGLQSKLEQREDQSEVVARLTQERDKAQQLANYRENELKAAAAERDQFARQVEANPAGTDKHSQRQGETIKGLKKQLGNKTEELQDANTEINRLKDDNTRLGEQVVSLSILREGSQLVEEHNDGEGDEYANLTREPNTVIGVIEELT